MSFVDHFLPISKKVCRTELPAYEIQNRLHWFFSNAGRGGPLHGISLQGKLENGTLFFEPPFRTYRKGMTQYAVSFRDNEVVIHARWKRKYIIGVIVFFVCAFMGFAIEMFTKPMERDENMQALIGFPLIYGILLLITKVQNNNVADHIKKILLAREV